MKRAGMMWRFFWLYLGIALFGMLLVTLNNIFINGNTFQYLLEFNLKAISVQVILLVGIFQFITFIRLGEVRRYLRYGKEQVDLKIVWQRLLYFPSNMFWGMVVFGLIMSPLFHMAKIAFRDGFIFTTEWLFLLLKSFLFEQTICLILAILFYSSIRRLLRPYLLALPSEEMEELSSSSFLSSLITTFISLMIITCFSILWYILRVTLSEKEVELPILFSIAGINILFGFLIFHLLASEFRRDLQVLIVSIRSLMGGERRNLHSKMPIISRDEVGDLSLAFNHLQNQISKEYEEIDRELKLAYKVQQRLLPSTDHKIGAYSIAALCQPHKEVGGDFYDIIKLSQNRFVVIIGDVSGKGMPAALLMSSMLTLIRSEIRNNESVGEFLTRLNRLVEETLQGDMFITLAIAIFDISTNRLEYASAGHLAPYFIRDSLVNELMVSSLPLGIHRHETYQEIIVPIQANDRLVFYTDGIVESFKNNEEMVGFIEFESYLEELNPKLSIKDQLYQLISKLPKEKTFPYQDDRTLIIVEAPKALPNQSFLCNLFVILATYPVSIL